MTTLSDTRYNFPTYLKHEQVGAKQLFICSQPTDSNKPKAILVSYRTIVGFLGSEVWTLTLHKYSPTTSKQLSQFARGKSVI